MTIRRALLAVIAFLVTVCGVIPAAQAHDYLVGSNPKPNATVTTAPKRVRLTFNDIVLSKPARPQVTVKGPDGRYYESGCGSVADRVVTTPVALGPSGTYTVTWRIVSADGHPVSDSLSFTYRGEGTGEKGSAKPQACTATDAAPDHASSDSGTPTAAIVAVVLIAVVGVGGAVAIVLTRGRGRSSDDLDEVDELDDDEE